MNLAFSKNNGEYLNKTTTKVIPSSQKENINELTGIVDKSEIINTDQD